jgi:hypothetical protein
MGGRNELEGIAILVAAGQKVEELQECRPLDSALIVATTRITASLGMTGLVNNRQMPAFRHGVMVQNAGVNRAQGFASPAASCRSAALPIPLANQ